MKNTEAIQRLHELVDLDEETFSKCCVICGHEHSSGNEHIEDLEQFLDQELEQARKEERQRIGLVFEANIIIDEEEDADGWYSNLKDKMRRVLAKDK